MTVASLSKFTVPLASDQSANSQGLLMPKLKYRFRVTFEGFGITSPSTELTKQVITFTRPSVSFDEITLDMYNSKAYLAGKPEWDAVSCTIRDDATGAVSKIIGEQLQKQQDFLEQASAASGIDYKFITRLEMLDGGNGALAPNVLETWEMYGCFLKDIKYGDLDYSDSAAVQLDLTIRFDNAIQTPLGTGVGTLVGRTLGSVVTG